MIVIDVVLKVKVYVRTTDTYSDDLTIVHFLYVYRFFLNNKKILTDKLKYFMFLFIHRQYFI